jgi:Tfp pilus assembly protein FimV
MKPIARHDTSSTHGPRSRLLWPCLVLLGCLSSQALAAQAVASPQAVAALASLTGSANTQTGGASVVHVTNLPPLQAASNRSLVVQPGQTLDRIIRSQLPHVPFKVELVRRAIMDLNPSAFPIGTPHLLRAGVVLAIPTPDQIRQSALSRDPQMGPYFGTPAPATEGQRAASKDKRKWVRFP